MAIDLESAVPWGRNLSEYVRMFALTPSELRRGILDVAGGPSSFNAESHSMGVRIASVDPLYAFSADEIRRRIDATYATIVEGCRRDAGRFVWGKVRDPDHLGELRMAAMSRFLADLARGRREGRYVAGALPRLPFADGSFDLAVCSHFLFLYSEQLKLEFHLAAVRELCRVAREVRVFPLLDMASGRSAHLGRVMEEARTARVVPVGYEFQKGANEMLVIAQAPNVHPVLLL